MVNNVVVEITRKIPLGTLLTTPSGRSTFEFNHIDSSRVLLHVGKTKTTLLVPTSCFEEIPKFLKGKGWVTIGAIHDNSTGDTLDNFIKKYTHGTSAASYVASILEKAKIIEILKERPAKVRLL